MLKFELTKDQKILIGCTAVVVATGAMVVVQCRKNQATLCKTIDAINSVADSLDDLGDEVDEGNAELFNSQKSIRETNEVIAKAMKKLAPETTT